MGLFSKVTEKEVKELKIITPIKTEEEIIQEIHDSFDTAQDRLLQSALNVLEDPEISNWEDTIKLAQRYQAIGFNNIPISKKAVRVENKIKFSREQAERIIYYKNTYPFLKFLTTEELDSICKKYDLIHASVEKYINNVPEKNLIDIENAQPLKDSDVYDLYSKNRAKEAKDRLSEIYTEVKIHHTDFRIIDSLQRQSQDNEKNTMLYIAAPKSHFNLDGMVKDGEFGYKQEVKDPIVFRYVKGGIQVLTKWGLEASDPSLIVDKLN
jgi:uncharacterized protein YdhG (YjbR/CyaY superfamily)